MSRVSVHQSGKQHARRTQHDEIRIFVGLVVLASIPRLIFFVQLQATPFFRNLFSDSQLYVRTAQQIVQGNLPARAFFMSPLYPLFLAVVHGVSGEMTFLPRLLQVAAGCGTVVLVYLAGKELYNVRSGIIAACSAAVYPLFVFYDNSILTESFQTLFCIAHLFCLLRAIRRTDNRYFIAAGIFFGLMIVQRASIGIFLVPLVLYALLSKRVVIPKTSLLLYVFAGALMILPFTVYNYSAEKQMVLVSSSGGFNLYAGNNSASTGFYKVPENIDIGEDPNGQAWVERHLGKSCSSSEVSTFWMRRAGDWMSSHPADYFRLLAKKVGLFFHSQEYDQLGLSIDFFRHEYGAILWLLFISFPVIFFFALMGIGFGFQSKQNHLIPMLFLLSFVVSVVLFFVSGRMRVPVTPILMLYSGFAIDRVLALMGAHSWKRMILPASVATIIFTALFVTQPDVKESYADEYVRLGELSFQSQNYPEAERFFHKALDDEISAKTLTNLGNAFAAQGRFVEAASAYSEALARDSSYVLTWFNLGNLNMQKGDAESAYACWKKAVTIQPSHAPSWRNLGLLFYQTGRLIDAEAALHKYVSLETDPASREEISRDIQTIEAQLRASSLH